MLRFLSLAAVAALLIAGCGGDDEESSDPASAGSESTSAATSTEAPAAAPGTTIKVGDSEYGPMLFDSTDQAIYLFDKEGGPRSECYGACAEAWPPVLTDGQPQPGAGAKAHLLGTIKRDDGSTQVTYNGHPLYFYAHEGKGEVLCHNVEEFGGLWLVVDPSGNAV